jgi:hypothetical protein
LIYRYDFTISNVSEVLFWILISCGSCVHVRVVSINTVCIWEGVYLFTKKAILAHCYIYVSKLKSPNLCLLTQPDNSLNLYARSQDGDCLRYSATRVLAIELKTV